MYGDSDSNPADLRIITLYSVVLADEQHIRHVLALQHQ